MVTEPRYGEMPLGGQRVVLGATVLGTLAFGGWWLARGGNAGPRDPALVFFLLFGVVSQWVALGVLLRPRGRGLREHPRRRILAYGFGASHMVLGILNAFIPILVAGTHSRLSSTGRWGWCFLLFGVGCVIAIAAWRSGRPATPPRDSGPFGG